MVQNYMETLVSKAMKEEFENNSAKYHDLCKCPLCLATIKAVALNHLPPFYVTCVAGEVFGEYRSKESQNVAEIMVAIGKGIDDVTRNNPHSRQPQGA